MYISIKLFWWLVMFFLDISSQIYLKHSLLNVIRERYLRSVWIFSKTILNTYFWCFNQIMKLEEITWCIIVFRKKCFVQKWKVSFLLENTVNMFKLNMKNGKENSKIQYFWKNSVTYEIVLYVYAQLRLYITNIP